MRISENKSTAARWNMTSSCLFSSHFGIPHVISLNHTTWSNGNSLCIPCGMGTAILFPVDQVMCDWLNHTMWFHSKWALPRSMEFESILLHLFCTIQMPIYYVGCLMIANTMDIYLPILLSWKTKKQFVFSHISLWTLVTLTFTPCKLCKMWADSQ